MWPQNTAIGTVRTRFCMQVSRSDRREGMGKQAVCKCHLLMQWEHVGYSSSHLYFLLRHRSQACTARGRLRLRAVLPVRSAVEEAVVAGGDVPNTSVVSIFLTRPLLMHRKLANSRGE